MIVTMKIHGSGSVKKSFTEQDNFGDFMAKVFQELHDKGLDLDLEIEYQGEEITECGTLYVQGADVIDQLRLPLD